MEQSLYEPDFKKSNKSHYNDFQIVYNFSSIFQIESTGNTEILKFCVHVEKCNSDLNVLQIRDKSGYLFLKNAMKMLLLHVGYQHFTL